MRETIAYAASIFVQKMSDFWFIQLNASASDAPCFGKNFCLFQNQCNATMMWYLNSIKRNSRLRMLSSKTNKQSISAGMNLKLSFSKEWLRIHFWNALRIRAPYLVLYGWWTGRHPCQEKRCGRWKRIIRRNGVIEQLQLHRCKSTTNSCY